MTEEPQLDENGNPVAPESGDGTETANQGEGEGGEKTEEQPQPDESWRNFPVDPTTGYLVDPDTGAYIDPELGTVMGGGSLLGETPESGSPGGMPTQEERKETE